jgi:serine phosphatase RsbU (regulator of sigma subunit)
MSKFKFLIIIFFYLPSLFSINVVDSLRQKLAVKNITDTATINIYNDIALFYEEKANDSCLYYANAALRLSQKINYLAGCGKAYNSIGSYYNGKGDYQKALANYIDGYKIYEKNNSRKAMSNLMNSIGNTYLGINNQKKALEAYTLSYEIASKDSNKYMMGISSIGLGNIYLFKKDANEALYFFTRAKNVFEKFPNALYPLSVSYTLIGDANVELNKFDEAFVNFNKAVDQLKTLNNTYGIAATYQVMGEAYKKRKELNKALEYFLKSYPIFEERKAYDDLKNLSLNISEVYKQQRNFEKALEYSNKYISYKDSVFNTEKNKQLLEVETKYETEKKEQQNIILKKQNDLSIERIQRQNILSYFIIGSLFISLLFGVFMYRVYSHKKKSHKLILKQKEQVEQKQGEIEMQKQLIELKQTEIVDSINYAKRIQYALLAKDKLLLENLKSHFVLFKPKDIVSGDFYWATEHEDNFYLAVCDSTGHGVPGAFMSLLSIGFLSEAIKEKDIQRPNEIFDYVRKRLIESVSNEEQKDGFDGVIIRINKKTKQVTYAAANNPPIIVSNGNFVPLKFDKMPVGKGENLEPFSEHKILSDENHIIYLYTDGYADQFGGTKGKKFKYKPLNEMLISISQKPLNEQSEILSSVFNDWMGNLEQVDDVCVIGIKL